MTKPDAPWHSLECVCYLKNPWCDASCQDDPVAWEQVEEMLMADDTWDEEEIEVFQPVKKRNTKNQPWN
jgi:hypothetical protein